MASSDRRFMVDDDLLKEVVGYGDLGEEDVVLEVGAGSGNLTEHIASRAKVFAIERDRILFEGLARRFKGNCNVEPILGDALKVSYPRYDKIISNLPYSISRKLIERFIVEGFEVAVLVVQEEFGKKLGARPNSENYRMLSVLAQSTCEVEYLRPIPPEAFAPKPKARSALIRLTQGWRPPKDYITFLNKLFSQKNKKVRNIMGAPEEYSQLKPAEMTPQQIFELYRCF